MKKRRRRHVVLAAFLLTFSAAGLIIFALRDGISYYQDPIDLVQFPPAPDQVLRLGGLVVAGSIVRAEPTANGAAGELRFAVSDGQAEIDVVFAGIPPDLFAEERGVVARGTFDGTVFRADHILAKHDENYRPRAISPPRASTSQD